MSPGLRRLLVIAPDAAPTADGVALLELVRGLVDAGRVPVRVLLQRSGSLAEAFRDLAPTTVVADLPARTPAAIVERLAGRVGLRRAALRVRRRRLGLGGWGRGDAVHLHSVLSVQALRYLPERAGPVTCRVPEATHPLAHWLRSADLDYLVQRVDRFLVVTTAGDEELRTEHDVPRTRVGRMAEVVVGRDRRLADREHEVTALRRSLAIPTGAVVLTSFAVAAVHDPPELCVTLVSRLRERVGSTQLCLVWVVPPDRERLWIVHDLERTGLAGLVRVVEAEVPLPPYVEMSDLMVHASRSPQHPLAYLDAAALGVPIVCFEHHDLAELVGADEGGAVCRSLDVVEMADRLAELVADPCRRARAGAAAADRVRERNGVEGAADRLWQQIEAAT